MYKHYLASGFFNPDQVSDVEFIEQRFSTKNEAGEITGINNALLYSPRQFGINMDKLDKDDPRYHITRDLFISEILDSNVSAIDECDKMIVNCRDYDIGTMWELGYFLIRVRDDYHRKIILMNDKDGKVEKFIQDFLAFFYELIEVIERKTSLIINERFEIVYVNEKIPVNEINEYTPKIYVSIDDRNFKNMILLGSLFNYLSDNAKLFTYSKQNFGSNLMLAGTINNHFGHDIDPNNLVDAIKISKSTLNEIIE